MAKRNKSVEAPTRVPKQTNPNSLANLKPAWQPGFAPNKTGKNGWDNAQAIAKAIFENNYEGIAKAMTKALLKGDPRVFEKLADRAFGKVPQRLDVNGVVDTNPSGRAKELLARALERAYNSSE